MKRRDFFLIIALLLLALAGCQGGDDTLQPPEIRYGEDVCDHCNMIISEPRFAAAYATTGGDTRRFDDIGEMILYAHERDEKVAAFWVHDFHSEAWIEAESATYVYNPELMTPMGWGVAAFAGQNEAQTYGDAAGAELLTFAQLQEMVEHGELAPQGMAHHKH